MGRLLTVLSEGGGGIVPPVVIELLAGKLMRNGGTDTTGAEQPSLTDGIHLTGGIATSSNLYNWIVLDNLVTLSAYKISVSNELVNEFEIFLYDSSLVLIQTIPNINTNWIRTEFSPVADVKKIVVHQKVSESRSMREIQFFGYEQ